MSTRPYLWSPWLSAQQDPARLAVVADDERCTFGELVGLAGRFGAGLSALGLRDGATVSTDVPAGPRFFALALAALRRGFRLFPVQAEHFANPVAADLLARAGTELHVGSRQPPGIAAVRAEAVLGAAPGPDAPPAARAGCLVFATSGTTGAPTVESRSRPWYPYKGVAVIPRYASGMAYGPHVMSNPAFHLGTLGPALYALQAGSAVAVQRTWSAGGLVELVDRHRADSVFLSPDRLVDVVKHGAWSAHRPRIAFHGGAACAPAVKRAAIDLMGPVLHEYYGTSRAVISEITSGEWLRRPGSVGRPLAGVAVEVRDGAGALPPGAVGEIRVRLRAIDRKAAEAPLTPTGDVGYLDEAGYLYVLGRLSDGGTWHLARLEHAVRALDGVTDAAVFTRAGEETTSCLAEATVSRIAHLRKEIDALADSIGVPGLVVDVRAAGSFPRTPSGKIARNLPATAP